MDIQKSLKQAWEILLLKEPTMNQVAKDINATQPALIIVAVVSVLSALGSYVFPSIIDLTTYRYSGTDVVLQTVLSTVMGIATLYLTGYLAQNVFHSKLDMNGYVRIMGHATVVSALSFFPVLSSIGGIWALVVMCVTLNKLGKMTAGPIILLILLEALIVFVLAGAVFGSMLGLGMGSRMF